MQPEDYIKDTLRVWANDEWPRRVTTTQQWTADIDTATSTLVASERTQEREPFMSVYSFPDGHTTDDYVPRVNTLFVDFDVPNGGDEGGESWRRELSSVLLRSRKVAKALLERDPRPWRAALSGNKGVHLYLDFPTVPPENGDINQFKNGLNTYAGRVETQLEEMAGVELSDYLDVTSADLARLCRVPNTKHGEATQRADEPRYCVPVSIEELSIIGPSEYVALTSSRRKLPDQYADGRVESEQAGKEVTLQIRTASTPPSSPLSGSSVTRDSELVDRYKREANDAITVEHIPLMISNRPCVLRFAQRDDRYQYDSASRHMELSCIIAFALKQVPIDVMVDYLSGVDEFDEAWTRSLAEDVISRMDERAIFDREYVGKGKNGYTQFNCSNIIENATPFCLGDSCKIYRNADDLEL